MCEFAHIEKYTEFDSLSPSEIWKKFAFLNINKKNETADEKYDF